eukprot:g2944.t1
MSYNNYAPPAGGMGGAAPAGGPGYGQPPPPPGGPPPGATSLGGQPQQSSYGGAGGYAPPSSGPGDRTAGVPSPGQQYGGYGGGGGAPPGGPPPPQQAPAPAGFGGQPSFGGMGAPPSNGMRTGPPPPMSGPPMGGVGGGPPPPGGQQKQPLGPGGGSGGAGGGAPSSGRGAQFYSVGGGSVSAQPTPMQGGPPTGPAPPQGGMGMPPPPTSQGLTNQMAQMSLGPPPNGMGAPPPGGSMGGAPPNPGGMGGGYGAPPQAGPPGMQAAPGGYQGAAGAGMGYRQGPGAPPQGGGYGGQPPAGPGNQAVGGSGGGIGAATGPAAGNRTILPSVHETDMSIQADPRVMRMTVGAVPSSSSAHAQSKVPLGLVIQAMALDIDHKDGGLEVVNFGAQGIMRCKKCRTYINPYVGWISNGRQWRCNVCGMVNDTPASYHCHLDQNGQRSDKADRPELGQASVELVAPSEYMVRPPQPPVYMFVIDVSQPAVASGMVHVAAETIKACLDGLPGEERTMVGFCTFNSSVHYYNLKSNLSQPQMLVVPDLADPFLPVPDDLLVNLSESRSVVDTLLDNLAQMHSETRDAECCLGPALTAAGKVMGHVGGKMAVLCASLPSTGEARLKHRENPRALGTDREHLLLKAEDNWYQNKAVEFSKLQICVDLFLFSAGYTDVATLVNLPKFTAGQLFYYPGFNAQQHGVKFNAELTRVLTRATAFEAVMRVRATRGLRITNFYGNYFIRGTDLLALPNCTPDSVFAVEFGYDEQLLTASVISIQAALLYTTSCGERRIRVHNMALPVETVIQNVFDSVSIDTLCNILAKQALEVSLKSGLDSARSRINQTCVDIIRASRGGGYGSSPYMAPGAQQQQSTSMSEAIQLLPLYSMALQKNLAFRGGADVRTDERASVQSQLANMPVDHSRCFTYPRMFSLHDMDEDVGMPRPEGLDEDTIPTAGSDGIKLPEVSNLSAERLSPEGVFLLEDGVELFLWVGRAANPAVVSALFGVSSVEGVDLAQLQLQSDHTPGTMTGSNGFRRKTVVSVGAILGMAVSAGHQALGVSAASSRRSSASSSSSRSSGGGGGDDGGGRGPQGKIRAAWAGSSRADAAFPLLHLHFCLGCADPAAEGSLVQALAPHHGIRDFKVSGDLVYAVPNKGNADVLLNAEDMTEGIVLFERGEVPVVEKVLKAQAAGATGVIVADDGGCNDGLVDCGRLGGARDGGFARRDGAHVWLVVKIPVVLVSAADGERLRGMMSLQKVVVKGLGEQLVERLNAAETSLDKETANRSAASDVLQRAEGTVVDLTGSLAKINEGTALGAALLVGFRRAVGDVNDPSSRRWSASFAALRFAVSWCRLVSLSLKAALAVLRPLCCGDQPGQGDGEPQRRE